VYKRDPPTAGKLIGGDLLEFIGIFLLRARVTQSARQEFDPLHFNEPFVGDRVI